MYLYRRRVLAMGLGAEARLPHCRLDLALRLLPLPAIDHDVCDRGACPFARTASFSDGTHVSYAMDECQASDRTLSRLPLRHGEAVVIVSSASPTARRPRRDARELHLRELRLGAELENGAALGDHGRAARRADVLLDPLGGAPGGLIGAGLVLA